MSFFIEANYDGTQNAKTFKPYHQIKDNVENIFRIAPPCRSLVSLPKPDYAVYNAIHFGYGVQDDRNPDKVRARPFYCIHKTEYKTGKVLVQCPECAKIDSVRAEMATLEEDLTKQGHGKDYIKQATSPQFQWLQAHNLDRQWYGYAKNLSGEWNIFKFRHKAKLALDERLKRTFKEDAVKGLDPSTGLWFKFTKNGLKGPNALTTVEVLKEKVDMGNGVKAEVNKPAPLTETDVKAIEGLGDVTNVAARLTYDQINSLVESGGSPEVAKNIFTQGTKTTNSQALSGTTTGSVATPTFERGVAPNKMETVPLAPPVKAAPQPSSKEISDMNADAFLRMFAKNQG